MEVGMRKGSFRRLAAGLFLLAIVVFYSQARSSADGPKQKKIFDTMASGQRGKITAADCSYLKDRSILGNPVEHARELSAATVAAAGRLAGHTHANDATIPHHNYIDDEI